MKAAITPFRVAGVLVAALLVTFVILLKVPSGYYLLVPDIAHPVAPLVHVQGGKPQTGSGELFFVDVQEEEASEFDRLFQWIHPHSTLVPAAELIPPGSSDQAVVEADLRQMTESQRTAAAVAQRQLGYDVRTRNIGVQVDNIYENVPAAAKIEPADVIIAADGTRTLTLAALHKAVSKVAPGQTIDLTIRRGGRTLHETVTTIADPQNPKQTLIGIQVEPAVKILRLPRKVVIRAGNIGGPSAGLAFTLEVMNQLGANVTHGYKVAATGTISLDGAVGPIGGIEQKTYGVRQAGAQVFLVPAGQNAQDARKFAGPSLKIIPVKSISQAVQALAALPKLPQK